MLKKKRVLLPRSSHANTLTFIAQVPIHGKSECFAPASEPWRNVLVVVIWLGVVEVGQVDKRGRIAQKAGFRGIYFQAPVPALLVGGIVCAIEQPIADSAYGSACFNGAIGSDQLDPGCGREAGVKAFGGHIRA